MLKLKENVWDILRLKKKSGWDVIYIVGFFSFWMKNIFFKKTLDHTVIYEI